ncbi:MAG: hypothetical protein WCD31_10140 [Gillisia sp.]
MKKTILIVILALFSGTMFSQDKRSKQEYWDHIKALKVAYITQEMNMNTELAQKFWPIYNNYECQKLDLHKKEHVDLDNLNTLSEQEANKLLTQFVDVEKQEYVIKKQLFNDLLQIMPASEIIKLHKVETDFNKKLLKEFRERRASEEKRK